MTENSSQQVNIIYNFQLWEKMIEGYKKEELIIQISKLYEEGNDPNSHFKKLTEINKKYIRIICGKVTAETQKNQAYVLLERKEQFKQNNEAITDVVKKWVAQEHMTTDIIIFKAG